MTIYSNRISLSYRQLRRERIRVRVTEDTCEVKGKASGNFVLGGTDRHLSCIYLISNGHIFLKSSSFID